MDLEIYVNGTEIPALYDFYADVEGTIFTMFPPPPNDPTSLLQMVLEPDVEYPTPISARPSGTWSAATT
ncbi:hypothetical protein [Shinella sp. G-2]|uniref:hypothetical protein n=1 Tax=Shinella sp. G-2 TaxID=3133141 RepID=UPI003D0839A3